MCHPPASSLRAAHPCTPHRQPEHYTRRRPERTPLYGIVAGHLETWLAERSLGDHPVATYVEEELRAYLRCGILSFGFARARCGTCGHDFLVAFSCKGRGVCPSCNGRRMAQTAAHLVDHVIPPVPVRQWVISVPKRLRW
ncbi:MAG: transposase zinc-binding domain-containing protein, partial [Pirellulales bacterium]